MDDRSSQAFCTQCGSPMQPAARYCAACGAPGVTAHPPRRRRRPYGRILGIWLFLTLLVAAAGFVYGWKWQSGNDLFFVALSPEQGAAIDLLGLPDAWVVADGPTSPDGGRARLEQWYHFDEAVVSMFVNGASTDTKEFPPFDEPPYRNTYGPFDFDATLTRTDIEEKLGEPGTLIDGVEVIFPDYRAYDYPTARLLIGYLDDRFYTAQTY